MEAIVYTSNTGYTKKYAEILSKKYNVPYVTINEAKGKYKDIIYLGWFMAGIIKGYKKAEGLFNIIAVCGVGMSLPSQKITDDAIRQNKLDNKFFYLPGGFDISKGKGIYKLMMNSMAKEMIQKLEEKTNRTDDDSFMLNMFKNGADMVSEDNLRELYEYIKQQEKLNGIN